MTIAYQADVSTSTLLGLWKLLLRWRGSVYKLICKDLLVYGTAYAAISLMYRFLLNEEQKRTFEKISIYSDDALEKIPLSFVLGFYVAFVAARWWNQFTTIPWPDRIMHTVCMYVSGSDDRGRLLRRTLMRYANLSLIMVLQSISGAVKKRFPTTQHLVEAGFMTEEEKIMWENVPTKVNKHWVPFIWFINLLNVAVKEGRIQTGPPIKHILEEVNVFRSKSSLLWCYDWVTVPLVYTQVVTLSTHLFFVTCLVGRQFLDVNQEYPGHEVDLYFPFFTFLQFLFFIGWLKVAEQLINPFGEDDDDFETNWLIDRHIQVSYLAVDELHAKLPRIQKDLHWDSQDPDLPYTEASLIHKIPTYRGSTMNMVIPKGSDIYLNADDTASVDLQRSWRSRFSDCFYGIRRRNPVRLLAVRIEDSPPSSPKTLGSKATLFENTYLKLLNRGRRRNSTSTIFNFGGRKDSISQWENFLRRDSISVRRPSDAMGGRRPSFVGDGTGRKASYDFTALRTRGTSESSEGGPRRKDTLPALERLSEVDNEEDTASGSSTSQFPMEELNPDIGRRLKNYIDDSETESDT